MPYKNNEDKKACQRRFYSRNKKYYIDRAREQKQEIRSWYSEYKKTFKCQVCKEDYPGCIDFHHKDGSSKETEVSTLAKRGCSRETIMKEIGKCIPLCSNCHRKLHGGAIKIK